MGGAKTIKVNVRVLAATNKNLEEEIENGTFRADLFYRLNVVPIHVPRLAERIEDIPQLVESLMEGMAGKGLKPKKLTSDAITALKEHSWPGNVRELRNFIERLVIMSPEETINGEQVKLFLNPSGIPEAGGQTLITPFLTSDFKEAKRLFEREYLQHKLDENDHNISKTAEQIGLERSHLHKKLKSLEIIN